MVSRILVGLLVTAFVGLGGPVVIGADETLERRKGEKIKAKGVFRDSAGSSFDRRPTFSHPLSRLVC
jgi:hypothetical protein